MRKVLIIDFGDERIKNNNLFDKEFAYSVSHTLIPLCHLAESAQKSNIEVITADVFLDNLEEYTQKQVFLMSHLTNGSTQKLITAGAIPFLLFCSESPFIATKFYLNLRKESSLFKYSFLFQGMRKNVSNKTIYKEINFPQHFIKLDTLVPFEEKRFLVMVSSAKKVSNWKKNVLLKLYYGAGVREIYQERIRAIDFFALHKSFDLFGYLWDKSPLSTTTRSNVARCYRGTVLDKHKVLSGYKFAICFENSRFNGYVTEKIFDCFFSGTIPIYFGAPDISKYVPSNTFIDFSTFKSYRELDAFLFSMDEATYSEYISNIKKFLNSDKFTPFTEDYFSTQILNLLEQN